jgi:hypothetical protein
LRIFPHSSNFPPGFCRDFVCVLSLSYFILDFSLICSDFLVSEPSGGGCCAILGITFNPELWDAGKKK